MTDVKELIGKELSMEVSSDVDLHINVLSQTEVRYQFIGKDDHTKDEPVTVSLEVAHDDIEGVDDYSFMDKLGFSRFFMFQFSLVN